MVEKVELLREYKALDNHVLAVADLIKPLLMWLLLTIVYAFALFLFRDFETTSFLYHVGLLLIAICFAGKSRLGLINGNQRRGVLLCAGFLAFLIVRTALYGFSKFNLAYDFATFTLVIFSPITEEIFWRGLILQRMLSYKIDVFQTIFANSILFAFMHVPRIVFLNESPLSLISILLYGIIFAGIYYLSKSTYYSMIAHGLTNIFTLFS